MALLRAMDKENTNPSIELKDLLLKIKNYYPSANLDIVQKAYRLAKKAHEGQTRQDGSDYITHPLSVACILADLQMDLYTIITGLMHDVIEDTSVNLKTIQQEFNDTVAFLVDGVSKVSHLNFKDTCHKDSENMRKMIVAMARDVRVIIVKLADRLHNMRTLNYLPSDKQAKVGQETLDIYAPLAGRLGIHTIKVELEDLAFQYSNPEGYCSLVEKIDSEKTEMKNYIQEVIKLLNKEIKEKMQLKAEITGRTKNIYSIYQKMMHQSLDYNEVYDILAFRICVNKLEECYKILGLIHSLWKPIPGRFKDYIAIPKVNRYQSLHSTVQAEGGKRIEVQIRTFDMHLLAEKGIAAHWKYKSESWKNRTSVDEETLKKFNWLQDLVSLHQQNQHSGEFMESLKMDLFDRDIYIFTPKGDVKEFPKDSTPIDFAYCIHTDLGHKVTGAKVNGCIAPLKYKLQNGDRVEVITSKQQSPSEEWLKYCKTSKAKSKIKNFLKLESRAKAIEIGKKLFEKELKNKQIKAEEFFNSLRWQKYMKEKGINRKEDIYTRLAYGKVLAQDLFFFVLPKLKEEMSSEDSQVFQNSGEYKKTRSSISRDSPVVVGGMGNIMVHFAKCCRPLPGDSITGFISRGKGIAVHRHSCKILLDLETARYVDVQWSDSAHTQQGHISIIQTISYDMPGMLKQMSEVFAEQNVNILDLKINSTKDMKSICMFNVDVQNLQQLQTLIRSLRKLKNVISVSRKE